MSIYDTLLGTVGQGYAQANQNAMAQAQMPTFADRFLAGLRQNTEDEYKRRMGESNLAMNQAYKQSQEENMRRQRVQDVYAGSSKMTLDKAGLDALTSRLSSMGETPELASAMLPKLDETGVARGLEAQKEFNASNIKKEHERNVTALNAAREELIKAQTELANASGEEKRALLQSKIDLAAGKVKMFEPLVMSQIYSNYNPTQYAAPIQGVDPRTGETVWLQPNTRTGGVAPVQGYGAPQKPGSKRTVDPETTLKAIAEAKDIIGRGSSGIVGTALAKGGSLLGYSTPESQANAELGVVGGTLTLSVPRMEGAQSEPDRRLYEQVAGDVANTNKSKEDRLAALSTMEKITKKYSKGAAVQPRGAIPTFKSPTDQGFDKLQPGDKFYDGTGTLRER